MILDRAIQEFDIEGWLTSHNADYGDTEWVLDCPKCGKHNLCVNVERRLWHCWTCERYWVTPSGKRKAIAGAGGLVKLLALVDRISISQAIDRILEGVIFSYQDIHTLPKDEVRDQFLAAVRDPEPVDPPEDWQAITEPIPFMTQRQITMQDVVLFGLGWCSQGRYAGRFVFPVWERGRLLYFQARAMWSEVQQKGCYLKSLNPAAKEGSAVSSELLMNLEQAARYPRVAIVEGPTDLVRTGPDAVCTFGKRITPAQIGRLMRVGVRSIDLMWDADARKEMLEVAPLLQVVFDTRLVFLPKGDPGDYPRPYLAAARAQAAPSGQYSILRAI